MKILAIDPGNTYSAYVLLDGSRPVKFDKAENDDVLMVLK